MLRIALSLTTILVLQSTLRAQDQRERLAFFEQRIRPLLAQHCYRCHSEADGKRKGGLVLDHPEKFRAGGDSGHSFVPGKPDESLLIQAVRYQNDNLRMPPSKALSKQEIADLETWVRAGAVLPAQVGIKATGVSIEEGKKHWAFQPLKLHPGPATKHSGWVKKPHDAFTLAALEREGLKPTAAADRRTLIRRLSFDLVGLPPSIEQIEAFANDSSPDAVQKLVDRLLTSPQHGERWGRYWLDLARYCDVAEPWHETKGAAHLYRDWVVDAVNRDLPFNQFIRFQLAADSDPDAGVKDLAALGFLGLSPSYWKELQLDRDLIRGVVSEEWEERIGSVSGAFLALTVACARCHDHKHDPIEASDYYALAGIFASTRLTDRSLLPKAEASKVQAMRSQVEGLEAKLAPLKKNKTPTDDIKKQIADMEASLEKLRAAEPRLADPLAKVVDDAALFVMAKTNGSSLLYKPGEPQNVAIQKRGDPKTEGETVPRRFLKVLSPAEPRIFGKGSGRQELAEAIVTDAAPLTARVIVNRVWKWHFGRGIVETPSDFGLQGDRPSHPELLDDLAARFVAHGWSLRWLHREIVLSATYQQASTYDEAHFKKDPDNRWLWRMSRRRLDAEAWRDAILFVNGRLDLKIGGPAEKLGELNSPRRTLYLGIKRREINDFFRLHDVPDPLTSSATRVPTTTPLQQLFTLNSPFMAEQSKALAALLRAEKTDPAAQVRRAFVLAYGRAATQTEIAGSLDYLGAAPIADARWQQFAQALLGSNEFQFVD